MSGFVKVKPGATLWDPMNYYGELNLTNDQIDLIASKIPVVPGPPGDPGPPGEPGPQGPPGTGGGEGGLIDLPGYDPATPYLLRGTVNASLWPDVTAGANLPTATQQANRVALNNAFNYANTNNKFIELEPGRYEVHGDLRIPTGQALELRGVMGSAGYTGTSLVQFDPGSPVLRVGGFGSSGTISETAVIEGLGLSFGVQPAADVPKLQLGRMWMSRIARIDMTSNWNGSAWDFAPSYGVLVHDEGPGTGFFSNRVSDIRVKGVTKSMWASRTTGTGNRFENIYLGNGGASLVTPALPITQPALWLSEEYRGQYGDVWDQVNIEWTKASKLISAASTTAEFHSVHLEGNRSIGFRPCLIESNGSHLVFSTIVALRHRFLVAEGMANNGEGAIFQTYNGRLEARNVSIDMQEDNLVDLPWRLALLNGPGINRSDVIDLYNVFVSGSPAQLGNFQVDSTMPAADFGRPTRIREYHSRPWGSETVGATVFVTASQTIYAAAKEVTVIAPAAPATSMFVTLGKTRRNGSTNPPETGAMVCVMREPGTANAQTVTVVEAGDATAKATLTAGQQVWLRWSGTAWTVTN